MRSVLLERRLCPDESAAAGRRSPISSSGGRTTASGTGQEASRSKTLSFPFVSTQTQLRPSSARKTPLSPVRFRTHCETASRG